MTNINIADTKLTEAEINAAVRVLRSGMLRQGAESDAFEKEFAAKVGATFAFTNANGTAALHLAYMAFLNPGEEVLVPSFTFIATGSMVTAAGGKPVFVDVDRETYLMDLEDAARKITPKTRAIAPVHLFGNACAIEA
ncbi:MAG TPA: aminotransferase class I/II-fold pyridoxal phosphate-dependent enzyme, partial [bacterium]